MANVQIMMCLVNNIRNKKNLIAIFLCVLYFCIALVSTTSIDYKNLTYWGNAITTDEMAHIPSGYYYLKTGKYFLNVEHPPLIKNIAALPLIFYKPFFPEIQENKYIHEGTLWHNYPPDEFVFSKNLEIQNAQWDFAAVFLFHPENNPSMIAFWARFSVIFFNGIFLFLLFWFLSKIWNTRIALSTLFLIIFSQFSIAHSSLVTMDFMSSLLQMISIVTFSIYIQCSADGKRCSKQFLVASTFLSLALLAKFSSIMLIPTLFVGGLVYVAATQRNTQSFLKFLMNISLLFITSGIIVAIYYHFHTLNMSSTDIVAQLNYLHPENTIFNLGELLKISANNYFLKGVTQYMSGILMVAQRLDVAYQQIYFMGNFYGSEGAGSLYFPILYATKMSLGFLTLNIIAFIAATWRTIVRINKGARLRALFSNPLTLIFLIFIYLYVVTSISSNLQIGLRHIFPIIFAFTILTAKGIDVLWENKMKYVLIMFMSSMLISVSLSFPNYIEYYNMIGGGTSSGYKIATDSNYDWGQGAKKIVEFVNAYNIDEIYVDVDAEADIPLYWYLGYNAIIIDIKEDALPESGSYLALSAVNYKILRERYPNLATADTWRIDETIWVVKIP
jgi:hypothetical protein